MMSPPSAPPVALSPHQKRTCLLDLVVFPLMVIWSMNNYREFLDTLCRSAGDAAAITGMASFPCSNPNAVSRTWFLLQNMPLSLRSYVMAAHPLTGPYPSEVWLLYMLATYFSLCVTCTLSPAWYLLHARPWMVPGTTLMSTGLPLLSLLTHPTSPPALYFTVFLQFSGLIIVCQHATMRVSAGVPQLSCSMIEDLCSTIQSEILSYNPFNKEWGSCVYVSNQ